MKKKIYIHTAFLLFATSLTITLQAQNVMKIRAGAIFSTTDSVTITLTDMDFSNDAGVAVGQGIFIFNGTATNTISGNSSTLFNVVQLAKTGNGKLVLQRFILITSGIEFNSGVLDLNAQSIMLSPTASLIGESETSHITDTNGGFVQITNTLTAPLAVNPGNLGAVFTSTADLGSVIIRRGHRSQTNVSGNGNTIFRYYDVIPSNNSALNVKLRFNYLDTALNNLNETKLTMWTSSDNQHWTNIGFAARDKINNYVEQAGINSFNRITLTETGNPLPLIWGSFNAQCISGQTRISWETLQEQNTSLFMVRRSTNGNTWTNVGSIPAAGNSQSTRSYSYSDPQSLAGTTFYQILQQDLDGRQTYSPVLVSRCAQQESINVYPIPAQNNCWVSIQSERSHTVSMHLYNNQGALLKQQVVEVMAGNSLFELSLAKYPRGVYSLVFTWSDGKVKVIKVEKI